MKREICCPKCAEEWRRTMDWDRRGTRPGEYPGFNENGEGMRQVDGLANFDVTCDGCGDEILADSPATAVSIYSETTPYFEWEAQYVYIEPATTPEEARP